MLMPLQEWSLQQELPDSMRCHGVSTQGWTTAQWLQLAKAPVTAGAPWVLQAEAVAPSRATQLLQQCCDLASILHAAAISDIACSTVSWLHGHSGQGGLQQRLQTKAVPLQLHDRNDCAAAWHLARIRVWCHCRVPACASCWLVLELLQPPSSSFLARGTHCPPRAR
jgi:hypothetical protein